MGFNLYVGAKNSTRVYSWNINFIPCTILCALAWHMVYSIESLKAEQPSLALLSLPLQQQRAADHRDRAERHGDTGHPRL